MARKNGQWIGLGVVGVAVLGLYQGSQGKLPASLQSKYDQYLGSGTASAAPVTGAPPALKTGSANCAFIPGVQYVAPKDMGGWIGYELVIGGKSLGVYSDQATAEGLYNKALGC